MYFMIAPIPKNITRQQIYSNFQFCNERILILFSRYLNEKMQGFFLLSLRKFFINLAH